MPAFPALFSTVVSHQRWGAPLAELFPDGVSVTYGFFMPLNTHYEEGTLWPYGPGRVLQCTQSGVSGGSVLSLSHPNDYRFATSDAPQSNEVTWGTAKFIDVTGYTPLGWDVCIGNSYTLMEVTNPNAISSFQFWRICFQGSSANCVLVDSESVYLNSAQSSQINGSFPGLHMNRRWQSPNEVYNPSNMWTQVAMAAPGDCIEMVSVDRHSPTFDKKFGAVYRINHTGPAQGYAYIDGFIVEVRAALFFSSGTQGRNVANLWFEDCVMEVYDAPVYCTSQTPALISVVFSRSTINMYGLGSTFTLAGYFSFEKVVFTSEAPRPTFYLHNTYFAIDFKGCDFSGLPQQQTFVQCRSTTGGGKIRVEECRGLTTAMLPDNLIFSKGVWSVEIIGGELDGVRDAFREIKITDTYTKYRVREVYRRSSARQLDNSSVSDRYTTTSFLKAKSVFADVFEAQILVGVGAHEVSLHMLLPVGVSFSPEELWMDISYPSDTEGRTAIMSSLDDNPQFSLEESGAEWEAPAGYIAMAYKFTCAISFKGNILATLSCAKPNVTFYVCPSPVSRRTPW